jgi:membrane protease YdiL (CAAX protease family)
MLGREGGYAAATRHPWPCLVFLMPLLLAYEGGLFWYGGQQTEVLRNGADTWLHSGLTALGLVEVYWAPVLIGGFFFAWSCLRRRDKPRDLVGVCAGMSIESVGFALALWGMSRNLTPFLKSIGIVLSAAKPTERVPAQILTFVGAGIYEEVLFRLLLFGGLSWLLRMAGLGSPITFLLAAAASAVAFSAAHHAGRQGEAFDGYVFCFRTLAGLYFTLLFQLRGFGIAVGTHACYDVLAGIVMS